MSEGANHRSGPADPGRKRAAQAATNPNMRMQLITLYVPSYYLQRLNDLVRLKFYPNRAEAIRFAIHDMILTEASVQ